ncbi:MAG: hypothetical protein AAGF12_23285 [Myxococcota bacterium]
MSRVFCAAVFVFLAAACGDDARGSVAPNPDSGVVQAGQRVIYECQGMISCGDGNQSGLTARSCQSQEEFLLSIDRSGLADEDIIASCEEFCGAASVGDCFFECRRTTTACSCDNPTDEGCLL